MDKDLNYQIQQEQLLNLEESQGWLLVKKRLEQEYQELNKIVLSSIFNKDYDAASRSDACMRKIKWVIELPQQIRRELAKGGDNT